jgi:hypothetical protein
MDGKRGRGLDLGSDSDASINLLMLIRAAWDGVCNGGPVGKVTGAVVLLCFVLSFQAFSGGSANKADVCVTADEAAWFADWDDFWVKSGCTWNKAAMFIGREHISNHSLQKGAANE